MLNNYSDKKYLLCLNAVCIFTERKEVNMSFTFKASKEFLSTLRVEAAKREMSVSGFIRFCVFEFINK